MSGRRVRSGRGAVDRQVRRQPVGHPDGEGGLPVVVATARIPGTDEFWVSSQVIAYRRGKSPTMCSLG